jgi:hypothetical protein
MIRRREFVARRGSVVLRGTGQQPDLAVIGFLHAVTVESYVSDAAGFAESLKVSGLGRGAKSRDRIPFREGSAGPVGDLAADLVRRQVALIVGGGDAKSGFSFNHLGILR